MGFRFRRSISLIPGVRINLSNGGPSLSLGPRGASVSIGRSGAYANLGLPGTGLSYRTRIGGGIAQRGNPPPAPSANDVAELERQAAVINGDMEWILGIHTETPNPAHGRTMGSLLDAYLAHHTAVFSLPAPVRPQKPADLLIPERPVQSKPGLLSGLFCSEQQREADYQAQLQAWEVEVKQVEQANQLRLQQYQQARVAWAEQYAQWQSDATAHAAKQTVSVDELRQRFAADLAFFEQVLSVDLSQLEWPRETTFTFEVDPQASLVKLDIDLPEIEDIPPQTAKLNASQTDLVVKDKSDKQLRLEYARHVHGCLLRIMGEVFATLPLQFVSIAGFTQRLSPASGQIEDDYILQCTASRAQFEQLNFQALDLVDPVAALERFELHRNMTSTGIFKSLKVS